MTFLAPWAFALGIAGAVAVVVLHLVARQRPAAFALPTTRFIPDQQTLVSRVATSPRDLLLLALRMLLLLAAAAAFARPVLTPRRGTIARVILLDRSKAVADLPDAVARVRTMAAMEVPSTIIAFDSSAQIVALEALDSLRAERASGATGSISAALVAARRAGVSLADRADSIELVVVSPLGSQELDAATPRLRSLWPGALRVERVALRTDSAEAWSIEHAIPLSDALGPAMAGIGSGKARYVTRLTRGPLAARDSALALNGGTVVRWDSLAAVRPRADAVSSGGDVIVSALGRAPGLPGGRVVARWADGTAAATENSVGTGCIRTVGIIIPTAGDLPLQPSFRRMVRHLLKPCGVSIGDVAADSGTLSRVVRSATRLASASALRRNDASSTPIARWLLAVAIGCALAELALRRSGSMEQA